MFVEVVAQMTKHTKLLKDLLTNLKKLEEASSVILNKNFLASMLNKLPKKMGDPGSLTLPWQFRNLVTSHALADSRASMNLMPYLFYKKLNQPKPKPIQMTIYLTDKPVTSPRGICEDLLITIDKFVFPTYFLVLYMEEAIKFRSFSGDLSLAPHEPWWILESQNWHFGLERMLLS